MADVLKGLGTVKLKSVQRSPGGTPVCDRKKSVPASTDPAALIAAALKRKFAQRRKAMRGEGGDEDDEDDGEGEGEENSSEHDEWAEKENQIMNRRREKEAATKVGQCVPV